MCIRDRSGVGSTSNNWDVDSASINVCANFDRQGTGSPVDTGHSQPVERFPAPKSRVFGSFFASRHYCDGNHAEAVSRGNCHNANAGYIWSYRPSEAYAAELYAIWLCYVIGDDGAVSYTHLDVYKRQAVITACWQTIGVPVG